MITAIDSNVIIGLWNADDALNAVAREALDAAYEKGGLTICGAVFGELLACPGRTEQFVNRFLDDTEISVDWTSSEEIWRTAGRAFQSYAKRRRKQTGVGPRRVLVDFFVGAHALVNGHRMLTLDERLFGKAFPALQIVKA